MPPYLPTLTGIPYRRRTVPGLAEDIGIDSETETPLVPPGLAPDGDIDRVVAEALAAEGLGDQMSFDVAEVDPAARTRRATGAIGEALAQAFPSSPSAIRGGALGGSDLNVYTDSPTGFSPVGFARPLAPRGGSRDPRMNVRPDARPMVAPHLPPNAPASAVAGAVPVGAPPAVSPSSPGAQPQGAGAATPPGQPAPSPVTPAPSSDQPQQQRGELATAAEAFAQPPTGQAKNAPAGVRVPGARENKGEDTFAMSQTERARLEEARRGDRRMRIGSGVAQGLGALLGTIGIATDTPGLAGLGMTGMRVGQAIPAGRRAEEVLGDVERRQQAVAAQQTADARQMQLATDADRVGVQRLGAEAGMIRAQGQAQLDLANAANAEFERAAAEGNAQGMRSAIRARIAAMPDSDPRKAVLAAYYRQGTQGGNDLDGMTDTDRLADILDTLNDVDSRSGRIEQMRGGSIGSASSVRWVEDPETGGARRVESRTGGGRGPSGPSVTDPFAAPVAPTEAPGAVPATGAPVAAPAARPGRPAARRGRTAAAAAAPAPVPGAEGVPTGTVATDAREIDLGNQGHVSDFEAMMENEGVTRGSGAWNRRRNNFIRILETGTDAQKNAAIGQVSAALRDASIAEAGGLDAGTTPEQRRLAASSEFRSAMRERARIERLIPRIRRAMRESPQDFMLAARYVGQDMPLPPNASRIAQEMSRGIILQLKEMSGAAVTDSELQRTLQSFGVGNWSRVVGDPEGYVRSLVQAADELSRYTDGMVTGGIGARAAAPIYAQMLGGSRDAWESTLRGLH